MTGRRRPGRDDGRPIARVLGVEIVVHPSWLIIFALVTASLAINQLPADHPAWPAPLLWTVAAAVAILFFASVVVHELAHVLVARRRGIVSRRVTLFIFGGAATLERESDDPTDELLIALAGPAASLFLGGLLLGLARLLGEAGPGPAESVAGIAFWLGAINVLLGFFNLVPGFPMDGGRILRGLLWRLSADFVRATRIATLVGRAVAYVMIGAGFLIALNGDVVGGLWLAFVGWFLNTAAESSYRRVALERLVAGVRVGEVMERDAPTVHPNLTLDVFVDQYLVSGAATAYAVTIEGDLFGTIGLEQVRATPREDWPAARVTDVMTRLVEAPTATVDEPLWDAIERFEEGRLQLLPVTDGRRLLGVVTRETLLRALRARAELTA